RHADCSSSCDAAHGHLLSFPTRRSSDLVAGFRDILARFRARRGRCPAALRSGSFGRGARTLGRAVLSTGGSVGFGPARSESYGKDRKSTRLNSSHVKISYAVFCLKKTKT